MKARTFVVLAGTEACNARCFYCSSKMLPQNTADMKKPTVNWRNFKKACQVAKESGAIKCLISSPGEATLFPDQISEFLNRLRKFCFPIIELQTNGIRLQKEAQKYLSDWYRLGLTIVAISVVSHEAEKNRRVFLPHLDQYIDLPGLIRELHAIGFSIRLACTMAQSFVDSPDELKRFLEFARKNKVEQVTVRPVSKPGTTRTSQDHAVWQAVIDHQLTPEKIETIMAYLKTNGTQVMEYSDGVKVFDVNGQNICFASPNWTKLDPETEDVRQLIFCSDQHLRYDWRYPGAIIF